jgi:2-polyprenyl-3-methyl-5-hydroxy-6-metoxy-1,4-benzoquinol methylase
VTASVTKACPYCGCQNAQIKLIEPPFLVVECQECQLVFTGNPPDDDKLYNEQYSPADPDPADYNRSSNNIYLRQLFAINEQRLATLKGFKPYSRLLDIGCDRGYFLKLAQNHGYEVQGIEVSERAIRYAQHSFSLNVTIESLPDLISSGAQFDIITLWHVLEHFSDPVGTLKQIHKLLGKKGICVIEVPNWHSLKFILSKQKWQGGNHPLYHRTFFTEQTLKNMLLTCGFNKVQRIKLSYKLPGQSWLYRQFKKSLNIFALDAFLDFIAWK